jgi:hypothetical protein
MKESRGAVAISAHVGCGRGGESRHPSPLLCLVQACITLITVMKQRLRMCWISYISYISYKTASFWSIRKKISLLGTRRPRKTIYIYNYVKNKGNRIDALIVRQVVFSYSVIITRHWMRHVLRETPLLLLYHQCMDIKIVNSHKEFF